MSDNAPVNPEKLLVVVTSLPDLEGAKLLARMLVEQNLAACVQLVAGVDSIYRWEGKICEEQEVMLSAKTTTNRWSAISSFIQKNHPYDLPEIMAFTPEQHSEQYGTWVSSEVNS